MRTLFRQLTTSADNKNYLRVKQGAFNPASYHINRYKNIHLDLPMKNILNYTDNVRATAQTDEV
jgi:hypothetical protein